MSNPQAESGLTAYGILTERPAAWRPTVLSLLGSGDVDRVVLVTTRGAETEGVMHDLDAVHVIEDWRLLTRVSELAAAGQADFFVCTAPVLMGPGALKRARDLLADDLRIATVSFFSNAANYLSLPHRNQLTHHQIEHYDELSLTARLRELDPVLGHVPIAIAAGSLTLVGWPAFAATGGFVEPPEGDSDLAIAEFSLRTARRGFTAALEASTYVARPFDLGLPGRDPLGDRMTRHWLYERHHFFPAVYDEQWTSGDSPVALAVHTAASKVLGLRVNVDGTSIGPKETGTQVQTLALVGALAERDDVRWVGVTIPGQVPRYAEKVLAHPKVRVFVSPDGAFDSTEAGDVVHRPFQPDRALPFDRWRELGFRTLVTLQDLIAYEIGVYHPHGEGWLEYRRNLTDAITRADGTVVISHDVERQVIAERMAVPSDRLFVVQNGTDHLAGDEEGVVPDELLRRGAAAAGFIVVLGTNFGHKNRDLAIRAWQHLQKRGYHQRLMLVGPAVPFGSSREMEAAALTPSDDGVIWMPDVTSEERNWLLRHADVLLYPTSAEGFGLVPFEAARFGTPTALVRFGPLAEVLPDLPVSATSWDPAELADVVVALLGDPALRTKQIEAALNSGLEYTWARTAEGLTRAYRGLLALPARAG